MGHGWLRVIPGMMDLTEGQLLKWLKWVYNKLSFLEPLWKNCITQTNLGWRNLQATPRLTITEHTKAWQQLSQTDLCWTYVGWTGTRVVLESRCKKLPHDCPGHSFRGPRTLSEGWAVPLPATIRTRGL